MKHTGADPEVSQMRFRSALIFMLSLLAGIILVGVYLARSTPTEAAAQRFASNDRVAYSLPPDKMEKAVALNRTRYLS